MHTPPAGCEQKQAQSAGELAPLVGLCRTGKLFEVQDWIRSGKPINPPPRTGKGSGPRTPLEVAVERGFHSLVRVLLDGGADFERRGYGYAMSRALKQRRFDLVRLLVEHGYDPATVDMREVFETWDGGLMEYFIDRGADVERGNPLAYALCRRIQTALRVLKRERHRFPSFQRQADLALRHHCKEGNLKWVSLMLWAGADPHSSGPDDFGHDLDRGGVTALGLAALHRHYEVFDLKQVRLDAKNPAMSEVTYFACTREGLPLLERLFGMGVPVNDRENGGCSLIGRVLNGMSWDFRGGAMVSRRGPDGLDTSEAREGVALIEFLARHGARWVPDDGREINAIRRSLLKLVPRYALAFFSVMATHRACSRADITALFGTASMKKHLGTQASLVTKFTPSFPDDIQPGVSSPTA